MKLQNLSSETTELLNVNNKKQFTVDTSNQMIVSILRDKLYSNKVAAVCREVASNSRDANREAGKGNTPIIIKITSESDLLNDSVSVSFKDSGIGINTSRIDNVFLKYGSSTKRDSNTQTGGFGIGAKTPFAYTNEFLISTISDEENGTRLHSIYQAIISNENGQEVSQLLLISSMETTEETGTEIIIPIKESDKKEFLNECIKATTLWETKPVLLFDDKDASIKINNLLSTDDFRVIFGEYNSDIFDVLFDDVFLEIDGIPYNLSLSKVGRVNNEIGNKLEMASLFKMGFRMYNEFSRNFILTFKTGELTMSASREEIEYTQENIKKIFDKYEIANQYLINEIIADYENQKTTLEKIIRFNYLKNETSYYSKEEGEILDNFFGGFGANTILNIHYPETKKFSSIKVMGGSDVDFYQISKGERFLFSKKNVINEQKPGKSFLKDNLFVLKSYHNKSEYAKNLTLQNELENKDLKSIIFIMTNSLFNEQENEMINLLKELDVEILRYENVEKTKAQRNYTSSYSGSSVKRDKNIGTIYSRKLGRISNYHNSSFNTSKLKIEYNKSENTVNDFNFRIEEGDKIVILPISERLDIKFLDKSRVNVHGIFSEKNNYNCYKFKDSSGGGCVINEEKICRLLLEYNYKIIIVKEEDLSKVKNEKNVFFGLTKAMSDLIKNEDFLEKLVLNTRVSTLSEVAGFEKNSYNYKKYYLKELERLTLLLGGLNVCDFETPEENEIKTIKSNLLFEGEALNELAKKFSKQIKQKDYSNYMTIDKVQKALDNVKVNYPFIFYIYNEVEGGYEWRFNQYDTNSKLGIKIFEEELVEMIKLKLKK